MEERLIKLIYYEALRFDDLSKIKNSFIGSDNIIIKLYSEKYFNEFKAFKSINFESGVKRLIKWNMNKIK